MMELLALRLMEALCLGLGLNSHALHPLLHNCHSSFLRLNHYPPAEGALAASACTSCRRACRAHVPEQACCQQACLLSKSRPLSLVSLLALQTSCSTVLNWLLLRTGGDTQQGLGISPHSDAGLLTILAQDGVPGLEVQHAGSWHLVQPIPGSFTVNIGDMLQARPAVQLPPAACKHCSVIADCGAGAEQ